MADRDFWPPRIYGIWDEVKQGAVHGWRVAWHKALCFWWGLRFSVSMFFILRLWQKKNRWLLARPLLRILKPCKEWRP